MMNEISGDWLKLNRIEMSQLKKRLAHGFNVEENKIDETFTGFIQTFVKSNFLNGEDINTFKEYIKPAPRPGVTDKYYLLLPTIYFNINIKLTTYALLGLVLDLYVTKGAASTILALIGKTGKSISKVHKENGEVCIYYQTLIFRDKEIKTFGIRQLHNNLNGQECQHPSYRCMWASNGKCNVTLRGLEEKCRDLRDSAVLSKNIFNKWKLEL